MLLLPRAQPASEPPPLPLWERREGGVQQQQPILNPSAGQLPWALGFLLKLPRALSFIACLRCLITSHDWGFKPSWAL